MEKTLVVLAAGLGSRFGGLKQIEPVGPSGEFLIDYSVYDAIKAGFSKVVFVIKKENEEIFKNTISNRIKGIKIEYAYQEMNNLPIDITINREKPLGTAHALYCAKDLINGPFALISSDDFYGRESYNILSNYLDNEKGLCVIGYPIGSTLSNEGEVKRGVILKDGDIVNSIVECKVKKNDNVVNCTPLNVSSSFEVTSNNSCSMLMYGFNTNIFDVLEEMLTDFLKNEDLKIKEFLLPDVVDVFVKKGLVKVIDTSCKWIGMTYKEDLLNVKNEINELIKNGVYPKNLWE
ncbi:MAG: sugar phosphate nucleotidyltransferase [bacterium]|nr:sugar phosphate nucleotidyltransferase [bacterium]